MPGITDNLMLVKHTQGWLANGLREEACDSDRAHNRINIVSHRDAWGKKNSKNNLVIHCRIVWWRQGPRVKDVAEAKNNPCKNEWFLNSQYHPDWIIAYCTILMISMAKCKTALSRLLTHSAGWIYCSLSLHNAVIYNIGTCQILLVLGNKNSGSGFLLLVHLVLIIIVTTWRSRDGSPTRIDPTGCSSKAQQFGLQRHYVPAKTICKLYSKPWFRI